MDSSKFASTSSGSSADAVGHGSTATGSALTRPRSTNQDAGTANTSAHPPIKCPRCDSLNTKFCYFNNYSHTQPRHFCKSCRRYWTEGGALRNVPVGGGCRKNKRIKQRPLINIGAATGLLDPSSLIDDTTSNMLARLSSSPPFPNFSGGASSFGSVDDSSTQLLNIAFSRFQESMRLRQSSDQSSEIAPYLDASYPALVHKQSANPFSCLCGSCGSRAHSLHHGGCGNGLMNNLESNLGYGALPGKVEHDVSMAGFGNGGYELNSLNSLFHDPSSNMHNMVGTSATATLASIEDQLSSFSNLQHVDGFSTDTSIAIAEQKSSEGTHRNMMAGSLQLLGHVDNAEERTLESAAFVDEAKERLMHDDMDEKPLLSSITTNNDLSLMMPLDSSSWQQPSLLMNEILSESQQSNLWSGHAMSRWQDSMHPMAATSATAAGGVL